MKIRIPVLVAAVATLLLVACRSTKDVAVEGDGTHSQQCVTAKMRYDINVKGKHTKLSGNLKMKKDKVISLQLVVLGLMEVARLELTPDHFLVIDRMNKQYARARYSDVDFIKKSGYDFKTVEKLMWGILQKPDKSINIDVPERDFTIEMTMLSASNDCDWDIYTKLSNSYKQVTIEQVIKQISRQ